MTGFRPAITQRIFCFDFYQHGGWFRIFGVGLSWKKLDERPMLLSERNGRVPFVVVRDWLIRPCPKWKIV